MSTQPNPNESSSFEQLVSEQAPSLLYLAFLLTGDQKASEMVLLQSLESLTFTRYSDLPDQWRSAVIVEGLDCIALQLSDSLNRTENLFLKNESKSISLPSPEWSHFHGICEEHVGRALLKLDIFPRWVVLLTTFCNFSLFQVCVLLQVHKELASATYQRALLDLTHNLAIVRGWIPSRH